MHEGLLGRAPSPFTRDDLKAAALTIRPGDDRLQQAFLADRIGQLDQLDVAERPAWIAAAGVQLVDRQQALLTLG